jgi:hypothetical protein
VGTGHAVGHQGPERDPKFSAGLLETRERIPTASTRVAAGAGADVAFLNAVAEIVFRVIRVQGHVGAR